VAAVYRDIPEELRVIIEPVVGDHDLELVDVDLARGRVPWRLSITVDTRCGDGKVSVERCARVSREIGTHLDAADAISVPYRLEVSSPGLDRILSREKDFEAACGGEIRVETRRPLEGRRRFRGRLSAFEAGTLRLAVDGEEIDIPFSEVARAHRIYEFTRADFGRGGTHDRRRRKPRGAADPVSPDGSGVERA
jgi:ribosome maturation factor RimP